MISQAEATIARAAIVNRYHERIEQNQRTKLSKNELNILVETFVELLKPLKTEAEIRDFCQAEMNLLEKGYPQSSIGSLYLPIYRKAIQSAIDDGFLPLTEANSHLISWTKRDGSESGETRQHWAMIFLKYDSETYSKLRQSTTGNNNQRQDNLATVDLDQYLAKIEELLTSNEPETLAIALAGLTGRRHTEIVSKGKFEATSYPYLLHFEGQQKDPNTPAFQILTLLPAKQVLEAIKRFRAMPEIQNMAGAGHDDPAIDAFNARVNRRTQKYFGEIVPVLEGFKSVSIHRLRALYGAVVVHFFCPEHRNEHRFLQHFLGHLLEEQGHDKANAVATQHYFHYRLARNGKILNARGIKIMANGMPPMPDQFNAEAEDFIPTAAPSTLDDTTARSTRKDAVLRIYRDERDRWLDILTQFGDDDDRQQDRMSALLSWLEETEETEEIDELEEVASEPTATSEPTDTEATSAPTIQAISDQARTLAWLTGKIESLEAENDAITNERDNLQHQLEEIQKMPELAKLRAENERMATALEQADSKLQQFRLLLLNGGGTSATTPAPAPATAIAPAPTPTPAPVPGATRPARQGGARERANHIFLGVKRWNRQNPDCTFAITPGLLESGFGVNRKAANDFVQENQALIWEHHQEIGVENERSHNRGKVTQELRKFVEYDSNPEKVTQ